jgi:transposase
MDATPPPLDDPSRHAVACRTGLLVGIDVAKDKLDVARSDSPRVFTIDNDVEPIERLVRQLAADKPVLIVVESTGGLENNLVHACLEASLPIARVHPGRVRELARGLGILSKTDAQDAHLLVRFGQHAAPKVLEKREKIEIELAALIVCRRQLAATRAQQQNRLGATTAKPAQKAITKVIATIDKQIDSLDKQIKDLIDADDDFRNLNQILRSAPGVGPVLSTTLVAELREMGDTNRRQVGALAGVAPYNDDSGTRQGKRAIRGGRVNVRCVLYMATIAAIKFNPVIKTFSDRLKAAGKASKVRIVACMRKFLTLLNAMVRHGLRWEELNVVKKLQQQ